MTRKKCTMSQGHFRGLVDQSKKLGAKVISVFGYGEPLMDRNIAKHIKYVTDSGLESFITTNATLLTLSKTLALLDSGLTHIRFSVHGLGKEYEDIHGFPYSETLTNIFNFIGVNRKKYNCKVDVSIIPTTSSVEQIREFWEDRVDDIEIWEPHNWASAKCLRKTKKTKRTCGRPERGPVQINADGSVMVCCFDFDAKLTIGDTHCESIKDILTGAPMREIRRKHASGDLRGLVCDSCDQLSDHNPLLHSTIGGNVGDTSTIKFRLL